MSNDSPKNQLAMSMSKNNVVTEVVTEPSISIPRTLNNITWRTVKDTFEYILGKGTVERVDLINDRNGEPFCKVFVHMRYWPTDEAAVNIREKLIAGEMVKIVYDSPWFWKCSASRLPKPDREAGIKKGPYVEYRTPTKTAAKSDDSPVPPPIRRDKTSRPRLENDLFMETSEA